MQHLASENPSPPATVRPRPSRWTVHEMFKQISISLKGANHFVAHPTSRLTFTALSRAFEFQSGRTDTNGYPRTDEEKYGDARGGAG